MNKNGMNVSVETIAEDCCRIFQLTNGDYLAVFRRAEYAGNLDISLYGKNGNELTVDEDIFTNRHKDFRMTDDILNFLRKYSEDDLQKEDPEMADAYDQFILDGIKNGTLVIADELKDQWIAAHTNKQPEIVSYNDLLGDSRVERYLGEFASDRANSIIQYDVTYKNNKTRTYQDCPILPRVLTDEEWNAYKKWTKRRTTEEVSYTK